MKKIYFDDINETELDVQIGEILISIRKTDEGVICDAWSIHESVNEEYDGAISTMGVMFQEAAKWDDEDQANN